MQWGDVRIDIVEDGILMMDGGAMFGVVPKALWNRTNPADEKNRIQLRTCGLLIRTGRQNILVDTGTGELSEKAAEIYGFTGPHLLESLAEYGLSAGDIDTVVCTHLHFDHCGGGTHPDGSGRSVPVFENARYLIQKKEIEEANTGNERTRRSYLDENIAPLVDSGQAVFVDGTEEICSGIYTQLTGAHTGGHQTVYIEGPNSKAVFLGDFIPTASHLRIPYIAAYDMYPADMIEKKKVFLRQAFEQQWLLIFQHDPYTHMGYLEHDEKGNAVLSEGLNADRGTQV